MNRVGLIIVTCIAILTLFFSSNSLVNVTAWTHGIPPKSWLDGWRLWACIRTAVAYSAPPVTTPSADWLSYASFRVVGHELPRPQIYSQAPGATAGWSKLLKRHVLYCSHYSLFIVLVFIAGSTCFAPMSNGVLCSAHILRWRRLCLFHSVGTHVLP